MKIFLRQLGLVQFASLKNAGSTRQRAISDSICVCPDAQEFWDRGVVEANLDMYLLRCYVLEERCDGARLLTCLGRSAFIRNVREFATSILTPEPQKTTFLSRDFANIILTEDVANEPCCVFIKWNSCDSRWNIDKALLKKEMGRWLPGSHIFCP